MDLDELRGFIVRLMRDVAAECDEITFSVDKGWIELAKTELSLLGKKMSRYADIIEKGGKEDGSDAEAEPMARDTDGGQDC
jgi:predicted translin family RNA/ssDNA-binding protein